MKFIMLCSEKVYDTFAERFAKTISNFKHGDPMDKSTTLGPQADEVQAKAVQSYLDIGKQDGKVLVGGEKSDAGAKWVCSCQTRYEG